MKLAHNEQCIALYPLTAHYSVGHFQPVLTFGLLRAHLFLGSFPEFSYLRSVTGLFRLWAKFNPWLHSARLWPVNPLGCFHSVIKYGLLTARYGPRIVWPMFGEMIIRPVEGTWILRPVEDQWILRPVETPWILRPVKGPWILWPIEGPRILRPAGGPWLQQSVCCHDYCGLVTRNRLLRPLEKRGKRTTVTTSK